MSYFRGLSEIFVFNSDERRFSLFMAVLIALFVAFPKAIAFMKNSPSVSPDVSARADSLLNSGVIQRHSFRESALEKMPFKKGAPGLSPFDPNQTDSAGWVTLGFSPKQARSIVNFGVKSGGYRSAPDLKRCFVIDEFNFKRLEPYIFFDTIGAITNKSQTFSNQPDEFEVSKETNFKKKVLPEFGTVDLNKCDTLMLANLPGIGPYYARSIVEYREKLGGYADIDQLLELWKFDEALLDRIYDYFKPVDGPYRFIFVNRFTSEELKVHPYLKYTSAKNIVNFRTHHGPYHSMADLYKVRTLQDSLLLKLEPYLKFE